MLIRLGYELVYDCPQPTPMLLMLNVHYTRVSDLVEPDHLVTSPAVPVHGYRDGFGNWCSRSLPPAGQPRLTPTRSSTTPASRMSSPSTRRSTSCRICPMTRW